MNALVTIEERIAALEARIVELETTRPTVESIAAGLTLALREVREVRKRRESAPPRQETAA